MQAVLGLIAANLSTSSKLQFPFGWYQLLAVSPCSVIDTSFILFTLRTAWVVYKLRQILSVLSCQKMSFFNSPIVQQTSSVCFVNLCWQSYASVIHTRSKSLIMLTVLNKYTNVLSIGRNKWAYLRRLASLYVLFYTGHEKISDWNLAALQRWTIKCIICTSAGLIVWILHWFQCRYFLCVKRLHRSAQPCGSIT